MKHCFLLLTLVFLLTACAPAQAETPTPTMVPATTTTAPTYTPSVEKAVPSPSDTPVSPPTATSAPAIAPGIEIGRGFNAAKLKEAIENGETLLNPDLTPEFVDALIDVLTNDQDGNPIDKVVTYDMVKDWELGVREDVSLVTGLHNYVGVLHNLRVFPEGIQVASNNHDIKAYGFYLLTTIDPQNPEEVSTFVNISLSTNFANELTDQVGILYSTAVSPGLAQKKADRLDDNDGSVSDMTNEDVMTLLAIEGFNAEGYPEGSIILGGWGVYGEENAPQAVVPLEDFPNELNHLLYPDLQAAFAAWHNGEISLIPVFAPADLDKPAGRGEINVFDQQ